MSAWPKGARLWTVTEIVSDARAAREAFRSRRLEEPKERYLEAFEHLQRANQSMIAELPRLFADPVDAEFIAGLLEDDNLCTALRYLGAPPISRDDLETLTGSALSGTRVRAEPGVAAAVRDVMRQVLDPKRFPWVAMGRLPSAQERRAAVLASTVVASSARVQTSRRIDERKMLESAVRGVLVGLGWVERPRRRIAMLQRDAPAPGEFAGPCVLGDDEADVVVGLRDHRVLALECKASNSEINSRKRINKEVCQDARNWVARFGTDGFVPACAIQGVFRPAYLEAAQRAPVVFFWGHRLEDLRDFVAAAT